MRARESQAAIASGTREPRPEFQSTSTLRSSGSRVTPQISPGLIVTLQRTAGNRATSRFLRTAGVRALARCAGACTCGGGCKQDHDKLTETATPGRRHPTRRSAATQLQRTPANKVSCAPGPLVVSPDLTINDPVAVITAAEVRANAALDSAIGELDFTIQQIAAGAPIAWPTISDTLGRAMPLAGLDPNSPAVWSGSGVGTARLLLRRLQLIRSTIGAGTFFFTCRGQSQICGADGEAAFAGSCAGCFRTDFCPPYWEGSDADRAVTMVHEAAHNFAEFVQDSGREGNAECYARFVGIVAGDDFGDSRLCPDPS